MKYLLYSGSSSKHFINWITDNSETKHYFKRSQAYILTDNSNANVLVGICYRLPHDSGERDDQINDQLLTQLSLICRKDEATSSPGTTVVTIKL